MILHIETLTPLHVGSGRELQGNFEYLFFPEDKRIALVDDKKVLDILGKENIHQWISTIDRRESLLSLLEGRSRNELHAADVGRRTMLIRGSAPGIEQNIREQIHDGMGKPYLPGSSVKGAIRTVVFTGELKKKSLLVHEKENMGYEKWNRKTEQKEFNYQDKNLSKKLLGQDPNQDIFRLLRPGDAFFHHTVAIPTHVLNKKHNGWVADDRLKMYIEAIPTGEESWLQLSQPEALLACLQKAEHARKDPFPKGFNKASLGWQALSQQINAHTARLIQKELDLWEQEGRPDELLPYMEKLQELLAEIASSAAGSCVLRIGFGGGVAAKTGGWQQELMSKADFMHWGKTFRGGKPDFLFPKTRRMSPDGEPLGFVRLQEIDTAAHQALQKRLQANAAKVEKELEKVFVPEPVKPQYYGGRLGKGSIIDAFVFSNTQGQKNKRIHLYLAKGKDHELFLNYPADIIAGKYILVEILQMEGDVVTNVRFRGLKKENR